MVRRTKGSTMIAIPFSSVPIDAGRRPPTLTLRGSNHLLSTLFQLLERRHVAGATPNAFLKARENAASDS